MEKIKVLQFPIKNSNGGTTHYALNNWLHMDKEKFSCDFATISPKIDFEDNIIKSGAHVKYISCYAEENEQKFADEMKKLICDGNYDVLHLHTNWWKSFLVEEIAGQCNVPKIIVHAHNTFVDIEKTEKRIEAEKIHNLKKSEFNLSMATDFCACSNLAADWLFGSQIPRDKIKILKNAIEIEPFIFNQSVRDKYRREFDLEDCFVIGHVGRMVYQKNQEFLIKVFAEVSKHNDKVRLMLVGSGPLEDEYKKLADSLHVSDKVIFTGARDDVNNFLQAMDLFCLPSRFEGLGIVLIEAQTAGLKCIASTAVPDDAEITERFSKVPLAEKEWVNKITESIEVYERKNMYTKITDAGYNIKYQIKEIEKIYMGEDHEL